MPTAKKLPSGSWRVRVYDYEDADGKQHFKSFTSKDPSQRGKHEVERMAAEWALSRSYEETQPKTLKEATDEYLASKSNVLSPSTLTGYKQIQKNYMKDIEKLKIEDLTSAKVQSWVNRIANNHSVKTVKNAYGFLTAVAYTYTDKRFKVKFPQEKRNELYIPTDEDVQKLLKASSGDLRLAIYLAAFGGLRRGEISALTRSDVHDGYITVNKSMGLCEDRTWKVKAPKTASSNRSVNIPEFLCDMLKEKDGRIVELHPDRLTEMFTELVASLDVPHFRFHDLRHYYVSINHALGVPDQYIMAMGGWSTDATMKRVYRNTLAPERDKFAEMSVSHFEELQSNLTQHDMKHDTKNKNPRKNVSS